MRFFLFRLSFLLLSFTAQAQTDSLYHLGIKEGLPSEVVYQSLEDREGYLWLATDQGVVRYDGRKCQWFGKAEGVPDNEVLKLSIENNGRIWIHCYNDAVAFFDPLRFRFVELKSLTRYKIQRMQPLDSGGMLFETKKGSVLLRSDRLPLPEWYIYPQQHYFVEKQNTIFTYRFIKRQHHTLLLIETKTASGFQPFRKIQLPPSDYIPYCYRNTLYLFTKGTKNYLTLSANNLNAPVMYHHFDHPYYMHHFNGDTLSLYIRSRDDQTQKDHIQCIQYNIKNEQYLRTIDFKHLIFHVLNDSKGNLRLSTLDAGMLWIPAEKPLKQIMPPAYANVNFYSVCISDGKLLAGNDKGEVVEWNEGNSITHTVKQNGKIEWQRNVVCRGKDVFTFSDGGIFYQYEKEIKDEQNRSVDSKVIAQTKGPVVFSGSEKGLHWLNTSSKQCTSWPEVQFAVHALSVTDDNMLYLGSADGLYQLNTTTGSKPVAMDIPELRQRITSLCNRGHWLWVATATDGLYGLYNGKIRIHLDERSGLLSNNLQYVCNGSPSQLWVAGNLGVSKIIYEESDSPIRLIQNISEIDGLTANPVNQMCYDNGYVYAATNAGVCRIPEAIPVPELKVNISGVRINQQPQLIQNHYDLGSQEKNIQLQFSASDLNGYFKQVAYSLNEGKNWNLLESGTLNLELESGLHTVWVRAIDLNKHPGKSIRILSFDIATPYWKRVWFWILVSVFIQAIAGALLYRRRKQKELERQKTETARAQLAALEQQAFVSLMNPHFMFNSLNSIQHYINHQDRKNANRYLSDFASLIRKNFEAAQQAFIPLEQEIENLKVYLGLEQMRFNDKFRFEITCTDDTEPEEWMMPTMILQPLVENAILHGIMPSAIPGLIQLNFHADDKGLHIRITDNGIGIENSRKLKQGSKHRSRGMELIHKRLHALSFFGHHKLELIYKIPFTDPENPGSETQLFIPESLYTNWLRVQKQIQVRGDANK